MNLTKRNLKNQFITLLYLTFGLTCLLYIVEVKDVKIYLYSSVILTILFIIYNIWNRYTRDYIDNEEQKINFILEEFNHLVNYVVDFEVMFWNKKRIWKYKVTNVDISRPKKIKKDLWIISLDTRKVGYSKIFFYVSEYLDSNTDITLLKISDKELQTIIDNNKQLNKLIDPKVVKSIYNGYEMNILNDDFLKKKD